MNSDSYKLISKSYLRRRKKAMILGIVGIIVISGACVGALILTKTVILKDIWDKPLGSFTFADLLTVAFVFYCIVASVSGLFGILRSFISEE